jgi:hypothetical protein
MGLLYPVSVEDNILVLDFVYDHRLDYVHRLVLLLKLEHASS